MINKNGSMFDIMIMGKKIGEAKNIQEDELLDVDFIDITITDKMAFINSKLFPNLDNINDICIKYDKGLLSTYDIEGMIIDKNIRIEL